MASKLYNIFIAYNSLITIEANMQTILGLNDGNQNISMAYPHTRTA